MNEERVRVAYRLAGSPTVAAAKAEAICVEQTVEFPPHLLEAAGAPRSLVGRIESLEALEAGDRGGGAWLAWISFPAAAVGGQLPQLLNVIFGNSSLKDGIRVEWLDLPAGLLAAFAGPRFGIAGLRRLLDVPERPLLGTALKPLGRSPAELAELAGECALGGIDLIKDDHGLADQVFAPFAERVPRCAEAVARANRASGRRAIYLANVTGPLETLVERARFARDAGAGGLLILPGLLGWDAVRWLRSLPDLGLPLMVHPALLGGLLAAGDHGMAAGALLGQVARLAGADASICTNEGGRFPFDRAASRALIAGATAALGGLPPLLPVVGGGVTLERVPDLCEVYGRDAALLIGGGLHTAGPSLRENCRKLLELVEG